jgi:hypothetical protein
MIPWLRRTRGVYVGPHYVVFPLLVGWLRWKFSTDKGNVPTAPDTGIDPFFACEPRQ